MDSYTSLAAQLDSLGVLELENDDLEAAQVYLQEAVAIADALALPRFRWGVRTNPRRSPNRSTSKRPWPSPMHSRCRDSAGASAPTRVDHPPMGEPSVK